MYCVHHSLSVVNHGVINLIAYFGLLFYAVLEVETNYNSLVLLKVKILNWGNDCFVFVVYDYRFKCTRQWS